MPKVSVIIPTYNRAKYIYEAINSVLNQTFQDYEIIVVDDGSTDNTREVLSKYNGKIKYFYKENGGEASARNFGIHKASGDYIAFLDSDDLWLPDKLEKQMAVFNIGSSIDFVYTAMSIVDENGNLTGELKPTYPAKNLLELLSGYRIPLTCLIKKVVLLKAGKFDEKITVGVDTDMWIRVARFAKIEYLDQPLAKCRKHSSNISNDMEDAYLGHVKIFKKILQDGSFNISRKIKKAKLSQEYYLLAKEQYLRKKYKDSFVSALNSIRISPFIGINFIKSRDSFFKRFFLIIKPYLASVTYLFKSIFYSQKKTKINILFYEASSGFGGSSNALVNIINHLNRVEFCPYIIIKNYGPQFEKLKNKGTVYLEQVKDYFEGNRFLNNKLLLMLYIIKNIIPETAKLYLLIRRRKILLAHTNINIISGIPLILAARMAGIPSVCYIRDTRKLITREKFLSRFIDQFIILNKDAFEIYKNDIPADKLEIIYDGIDFDEFDANISGLFRKELNIDRLPLIGLIGRIVKGKGQKEFILSAKEVLKQKPDSKFVIVGDAKGEDEEYYNEVKELVKSNNLEKNIIFTGWRVDTQNIISDLDVFVFASTTFPEGLPNIILEAMALGKPVVATDIPGPSEIVIDGETGFLVPPCDIKAMAEKIILLLDNPYSAKAMGEKGKQRVASCFNIKDTVRKIEELYNKVLKKNKSKELEKKC